MRERERIAENPNGNHSASFVSAFSTRLMPNPIPIAYMITFTCYGIHLHGIESGSVDRRHNVYGTPFLRPQAGIVMAEERIMKQNRYELDSQRRALVLESLQNVCSWRGWNLLAAHVRSSHVNLVVSAEESPERILNDAKAYASRTLNRAGIDPNAARRWSHHGSTRYLWKPEDVGAAINYVVREQGSPMAVWEKSEGLS